MADLPPLKYGKVVGRFLANIVDGPDIDDLPEFPPLTGTVTFTAGAPKVLVAQAQPAPATYVQLPEHHECHLDESGYLSWRGGRGVRLVAPSPATNPTDWTWRVSFDLWFDGRRIPMDAFDFELPEYVPGIDPADPDSGSTGLVDLTLVSPVPGSGGTGVVAGPRGDGLRIDGQVATYSALPAGVGEGAQYVVRADGLLYVFHAAAGGWPATGQGIVIRGPAGSSKWADIVGKPETFAPIIGPGATAAVAGDDPRLHNPRTPVAHSHSAAALSDVTDLGRALLLAADASAARMALNAVGTNDTRLSDARRPTPAGQAYDIAFKSHMGIREAGAGNVKAEGLRIERDFTVQAVTYRGETAGTGNLTVELRRNGVAVAGTSAVIAAANHNKDTTVTGTWNFVAGDRLTVHITAVDSPAGDGLQASLKGVTV
ncbi:hypothetical protein [Nocardia sp. NPDC050435]|uniref:hypothetical protein n=1 Tax=Nocardia sp. NPDC050435 TaxID=3155040 RepID=UPI0033C45EBA